MAAPLPRALVIAGAGSSEVDGIYQATGAEYCGAPIYEHTIKGADFKITREPHKSAKTGATKHGWLLGVKKAPHYGVQTESLVVPSGNWKKFGGEAPVPSVKTHASLADVYYTLADEAKVAGEAEAEQQQWKGALAFFDKGIDALKQSDDFHGDPFKSRAALLLSRRAGASAKLHNSKDALRDALAALELARGLTSAEQVATEAARDLGCPSEKAIERMMEQIGNGLLLDPTSPLALRCVERWIGHVLEEFQAEGEEAVLPLPSHMPADRYLDGCDEATEQALIKKYLPGAVKEDGGNAVLASAQQCLVLMERWEQVLQGNEFQQRQVALWERSRSLSYPRMLEETRKLVAETLGPVLQPLGYAPGTPGLTRCVKQMQQFWSTDKTCARKALDLEELADVSLADLNDEP